MDYLVLRSVTYKKGSKPIKHNWDLVTDDIEKLRAQLSAIYPDSSTYLTYVAKDA